MGNPRANLISAIAYESDRVCRGELAEGVITGERDYVSSLLVRIRDKCKSVGLQARAFGRVLDGGEEQRLGCDALIILRRNGGVKMALFEAKYVHSKSGPRDWDYKTKKGSHFSDQLTRQERIPRGVFVWEQFLLGIRSGAQTRGFDPWGATCLVKDEVIAFDETRARSKKWTWDELKTLCESVQARGRSLSTMLYRLGRCAVGEQYEVNGGIAVLPLPADTENVAAEVRIEIPASLGAFEDLAPALAERLGISGALFVDITSEEQ